MSLLRNIKNEDFHVLKKFLNTKINSSITVRAILEVEEKFKFSRSIYLSSDDPTKFIFAKDIVLNPKSFYVFWDADRLSDPELKEYLLSVPDWKWDENFMTCCIDFSLVEKLDSILLRGQISSRNLKNESCYPNDFVLRVTEEKLVPKSLPEGYQFGVLKDTHIPFIYSKWKYNELDTVENYQKYVKIFPTSAVYKKEDRDQRQPLSWIIFYNYGFMGMMYTVPEYRRLGLASAVLSNLCSKLAKDQILILTQVEVSNKASLKMHKKLGFEIVSEDSWNEYSSETN